jgi:hypothetical protein
MTVYAPPYPSLSSGTTVHGVVRLKRRKTFNTSIACTVAAKLDRGCGAAFHSSAIVDPLVA